MVERNWESLSETTQKEVCDGIAVAIGRQPTEEEARDIWHTAAQQFYDPPQEQRDA
jgi:hypothetical protein